jgi:hypothetical protein
MLQSRFEELILSFLTVHPPPPYQLWQAETSIKKDRQCTYNVTL